jgi:uncharacterized protein YdcH (DUF465 family)
MAETQLRPSDDVKASLLRTDEAFRQLVSEHHDLDERIRHLTTLSYLTDQQQYEAASMKKRKLALKDRIEAMVRSRDAGHLPSAP